MAHFIYFAKVNNEYLVTYKFRDRALRDFVFSSDPIDGLIMDRRWANDLVRSLKEAGYENAKATKIVWTKELEAKADKMLARNH